MKRISEKIAVAIKWGRLLVWILEKILDAIETYPKDTSSGGDSGGRLIANKEEKPGTAE